MAVRLPSGNWRTQASKTIDGKQVRKSFTAETRAEADYLAAQWKKSVKEESKPENKTLRQVCEMYIELKRPILSPSTIAGYEKILRCNFADFMHVRVSQLTKLKCQQMVAEESKRISAKSVANAWGFISSALRMYGYEFKVSLPERADKVVQIPSPSRLIPAIVGSDVELPCLLALWCGLTMSEIRGARVEDVRDGILYINRVIVDVDGVPTEKEQGKEEKRTRAVRLPEHILNLLPEKGYLETRHRNTIYRHFKEILRENDIPDMTFHQLRHVFATVGAMLNVPSKVMQEKGGWKTSHTMEKVYQHTFTEERQKADDEMDRYFEQFV